MFCVLLMKLCSSSGNIKTFHDLKNKVGDTIGDNTVRAVSIHTSTECVIRLGLT